MSINKKEIYLSTIGRLLSLWILPLIVLAFASWLFIDFTSSLRNSFRYVWLFLFFFPSFCFFAFLFFNHLKHANQTRLTIFIDKEMIIEQYGRRQQLSFSEIQEITERSISKFLWSGVFYWKIKTVDQVFIISSLTISRANFERYFYNRTDQQTDFFPVLPKLKRI